MMPEDILIGPVDDCYIGVHLPTRVLDGAQDLQPTENA